MIGLYFFAFPDSKTNRKYFATNIVVFEKNQEISQRANTFVPYLLRLIWQVDVLEANILVC